MLMLILLLHQIIIISNPFHLKCVARLLKNLKIH
jgi:hypothetical protein